MSEDLQTRTNHTDHLRPSTLIPVAVAVALLCAMGSLVWAFLLQGRLSRAEAQLAAAQQTSAAVQQRISASDARSRAASESFAQKLGSTQAQIDARADALLARQQADSTRLAGEQHSAEQRLHADVSSVQSEVGSVKTDVGSVRSDLGATRADLAETKSQLQRTVGDAGVMSGLIARNHDDLETLRHRGDRTYYEFNLQKNASPTLLSSVKLQLKKADAKKGRYTLSVNSDDRIIEKKDKTMDEPVQFYSGKNPALFEIVVNTVTKNNVTGYLSVPKGS
ncbi:MAG: hypothetical protein ACRYGF_04485 [Janthinobacterium lividum]